MDEPARKYLVVVQFKADTSIPDLAKRVPGLQGFISGLCNGEMEQVFRTAEGLTFGIFFKSSKPLGVINAVLDGATSDGDSFLVTEIGSEAISKGFGRPLTWLQRH